MKNQRVRSSLNNYIASANLPSDIMIKKVSTEKNFRTLLSKREEWEREYTDYNLKENTVKWNTNGSEISTGAGAGIYGTSTKCALSLGSCMSVFQEEILAIERYLDINLERNYQKGDIFIHSDSQAAVEALSSYVIDSKMIWEYRNKLNEVGNKKEVFLI